MVGVFASPNRAVLPDHNLPLDKVPCVGGWINGCPRLLWIQLVLILVITFYSIFLTIGILGFIYLITRIFKCEMTSEDVDLSSHLVLKTYELEKQDLEIPFHHNRGLLQFPENVENDT